MPPQGPYVAVPQDESGADWTAERKKKWTSDYCLNMIPFGILSVVILLLIGTLFVYPRILNIEVEDITIDSFSGVKLELSPPSLEIPLIMDVNVYNPLLVDLKNVNVTVFGYYPAFSPPAPIGHGYLSGQNLQFLSHQTTSFKFPYALRLPDASAPPPPTANPLYNETSQIRSKAVNNKVDNSPSLFQIVSRMVEDCWKNGNITLDFSLGMAAETTFWHSGGAMRRFQNIVLNCSRNSK